MTGDPFARDEDIEVRGEADRKAIIAAMEEHGLGCAALGKAIAEVVVDPRSKPETRMAAIHEAIELRAARPKRVSKVKLQSEQRTLSLTLGPGALPGLGVTPDALLRLPAERRQKLIEAQKIISDMERDDNGRT